ncbi:DUF6506 family protein [Pseudomonas tolaasii]|uniref:DUF6506 family protein n=1 Tax=Pseudomonas tolaasii TaxID=29442 RepID=UPI001C6075BB|nr:DUF6506 family protein [Pseudomonas tolaasii]MBW4793244.1 hypothetical protein [Pseudomonas tolaasii]
MIQIKYAFVVKAPGYSRGRQSVQMESPQFFSEFVGVADCDEAIIAIENLVLNGTQVIELCGGFSAQETTKLRSRFSGIDIGHVTYS